MHQNQQPLISEQIYKIQTDRKLIAFYDRLKGAPLTNYAQLHAKGEAMENEYKVRSLIGVTIQDYTNGTGSSNVIVQFNLAPEQIQFFLSRIASGFQEFEWHQSKIFGNPDPQGYSIVQQFSISRHATDPQGQVMNNPGEFKLLMEKASKLIIKMEVPI